jgi:4-hydroxy-tetrahydrodipicolinate reductase
MAPNMSAGVNLLFRLAAEAAAVLGDDYDVEITEVHHRYKKDAPSGTANRLAEIIAEALKRNLDTEAVYGRKGITGERTRNEIGIHALRAGDVVGEHTVTFGTIGERIELTHRAQSRDALAKGALRAAKFVVKAAPGFYDMQDVLGLK